jgi:hypothetical protein
MLNEFGRYVGTILSEIGRRFTNPLVEPGFKVYGSSALDLSLSVYDSVAVSESVSHENYWNFSLSESITVSELIGVELDVLNISQHDTITVSESNSETVDNAVNVYSSITISEYESIGVGRVIDVYDSIPVSEFENTGMNPMQTLDVQDGILVSDFAFAYDTELFVGPVVSTVAVSEVLDLFLDLLHTSVVDAIAVSEFEYRFLDELNVSVGDSASVLEDLFSELKVGLDVAEDVITISETIAYDVVWVIDVSDSIAVSENLTMFLFGFPKRHQALQPQRVNVPLQPRRTAVYLYPREGVTV